MVYCEVMIVDCDILVDGDGVGEIGRGDAGGV
jgi:hypothetical protein